MSDTTTNRIYYEVDADAKDMRYSGRNTSTDCQFSDPFLGSRGRGVHAYRKYRFNGYFS